MEYRGTVELYAFGQHLEHDIHFLDHMEHGIPVQIYYHNTHKDIGFIEGCTKSFIRMNNIYYSRSVYRFVSRPGY